ncbi:opsin-3 isoform X2 [Sceloporus undulatus]|uniref:opsin-3 isoform X2 n=1 Tax=Sceloporus undulatus TaxID=8520 RepID=UPI001C4DBB3F|nr:opsin-3 isoform X2 [Sceloporus undulatus]
MYSGNGSKSGGGGHSLEPSAAGEEDSAEEEAPGSPGGAPPFSAGTYEALALAVATIGVLGVCNNLLVLVLYGRFKRLRTPTHLLLANISLSDLLVSLFGVALTFLSCLKRRWAWDAAGCLWDGFSNSLFGIVSIMTLTVLSYERYIRVVHARVIDFSWSWRAITYIWLYSLAWTGAPLLGWNRYTLEKHGLGCSVDWRSKEPSDASFVLFFFLGCLVAPVGIMAYCYGHILYAIRMLRCVEDLQTVQVIKILRYEKKFRRCLMQLFCVRLLRFKRSLKERPVMGNKPIRPIVMSQKPGGRPKKKVTFSSSSIIFIITSDDTQQIDDYTKYTDTKINVIQVKPL